MNAFADETNIHDLHVAHVRFGGDVFLQPGTKRFAEQISEDGKCQSERDEHESPTDRFDASQRRPGKSRRESRSGRQVRAATFMNSEFTFTGAESRQRLICRSRDIFKLKV